jgi:hypothetical protein
MMDVNGVSIAMFDYPRVFIAGKSQFSKTISQCKKKHPISQLQDLQLASATAPSGRVGAFERPTTMRTMGHPIKVNRLYIGRRGGSV